MSDTQLTIQERLKEAFCRFDVTQNKAAKEMGYSGPALSSYLTGTYSADQKNIEDAALKWLARKEEAAKRLEIPIVEVSAMKQIERALRLAHEECDIALIVGEPGGCKTTSCKKYQAENARNCILIRGNDAINKKALTELIAHALGIETRRIAFPKLIEAVGNALRGHEMLVIIDEADSLRDDTIEFSRRLIFDGGDAGLALVGLPNLAWRIQSLRNDHRQLESRIGVFWQAPGLTKQDAGSIMKAVWPECDKDILSELYKLSQNDVRKFTRIMSRAQSLMVGNKLTEPDLDIIEMAGRMVLKRRT